jgi:hypothetical protein
MLCLYLDIAGKPDKKGLNDDLNYIYIIHKCTGYGWMAASFWIRSINVLSRGSKNLLSAFPWNLKNIRNKNQWCSRMSSRN